MTVSLHLLEIVLLICSMSFSSSDRSSLRNDESSFSLLSSLSLGYFVLPSLLLLDVSLRLLVKNVLLFATFERRWFTCRSAISSSLRCSSRNKLAFLKLTFRFSCSSTLMMFNTFSRSFGSTSLSASLATTNGDT